MLLDIITAEFSDLPAADETLRVILRLLVAALLGGLLGYEREYRGKAAGMRTHMLVALGSAIFVLVPLQAGISDADLSRVIQGVVAGVGFLCAGAILKHGEQEVHGLTTAAGLWLTAAIGLAVGMGRESTAVLSAVLAFCILHLIPKLGPRRKDARADSRTDGQ